MPTRYEITATEEQILLESASQVIEQDYSDALQLFLRKYGLEEFDGLGRLFPSIETYKSTPLHEVISRETMTDRLEHERKVKEATEEINRLECEKENSDNMLFFEKLIMPNNSYP